MSDCVYCVNYLYCHGMDVCNSFVSVYEDSEQRRGEREEIADKAEYREAWTDYVDESLD